MFGGVQQKVCDFHQISGHEISSYVLATATAVYARPMRSVAWFTDAANTPVLQGCSRCLPSVPFKAEPALCAGSFQLFFHLGASSSTKGHSVPAATKPRYWRLRPFARYQL